MRRHHIVFATLLLIASACKTGGSASEVLAGDDFTSKISTIREPLIVCEDGPATWSLNPKIPMIWRSDFAGSSDGYELTGLWFTRKGTYTEKPNKPYEFLATGSVFARGVAQVPYTITTVNNDGTVQMIKEIKKDNIVVLEKTTLACETRGVDDVPGPPKGDFLCMGPGEASFFASGFLIDSAAKKIYEVTVSQQGNEPRRSPLDVLAFKSDQTGHAMRALGGFMGEPRGFAFKLQPSGAPGNGKLVVADAILSEEDVFDFKAEGLLPPSGSRTFTCAAP